MNVFISYARKDQLAATQLRADIEQLGHQAWFDQEVTGGHQWWSTILRQIQRCAVFVVVLSPDSLRSKACNAELQYAAALQRPILPIVVKPVNLSTAPPMIANTQLVDYTTRTSDTAFALLKAFNGLPPAGPLPMPPPPEPEIPASYLNSYLEQLEAPELTFTAQAELFVQLRARLAEDDEWDTVWELLARLRRRPDLAQSLVADLDELLAPSWRPDPQGRFERRFWDGRAWTTRVWQDGREFDEQQPQPQPQAQPHHAPHLPSQPRTPKRAARPSTPSRPWILGGVALLGVGAIVLLVVLLSGGSATDDARTVAQQFVDAVNARDADALRSVLCSENRSGFEEPTSSEKAFTVSLDGVTTNGDSGSFTVVITAGSDVESHQVDLVKESGEWKACVPPDATNSDTSGTEPSSP